MPVANTGLASGGQTFEGESSCGLSRPNAKPRTVSGNNKKAIEYETDSLNDSNDFVDNFNNFRTNK